MKRWIGFAMLVGVAACSSEGDEGDAQPAKEEAHVKSDLSGGKAEAWSASDSPGNFQPNLEYRIASLPANGEAARIPWASSYWPVYQDNVNYRWDGAGTDSAAAKYGKAFGVTGVEDAVSLYHGIDGQKGSRTACTQNSQCNAKIGESCAKRVGQSDGVCIPTWWGICHAWGPAAVLLPEPKYPVTRNGVTFKVNDIKALVDLVHNSTDTRFVSLRCNKNNSASEIAFDNYGRPNGNSPECRDTNPGTYHVLLTNYLGIMRQSFVEDRTFDDQVWNQPLRGYNITRQQEITGSQANALVGVNQLNGSTVNRTGQVQAGAWSDQGAFPVTPGQVIKVAMTGNGDADLYVNLSVPATSSVYTCRPYLNSANETCLVPIPAGVTQVYVSVNGYQAAGFSLAVTTGIQGPPQYTFNPAATKFYDVAMDVKYISESASEQDGNLADTIDKYTKTDHYEYVLEVDAGGRIVGGEWKGASKVDHPDFVWLPLGPRGDSVAGGKITYANVKSILDESLNPPSSSGSGGTPRSVTDHATLAQNGWKTYGPYNVGAGATLSAVMTGSGDADLYVAKGAAPSLTAYECRPYTDGTGESCTVNGPGVVYVSVHGYAASSAYDLKINYTEGGGGGGGVVPGAFQHISTSGNVAQDEMKVFNLPIPAGKKVVIRTTAPKDVDLYVQMDSAPTAQAYLARAFTSSGNETITYTATSSGILKIGVHGYAASSFTLRTSDM